MRLTWGHMLAEEYTDRPVRLSSVVRAGRVKPRNILSTASSSMPSFHPPSQTMSRPALTNNKMNLAAGLLYRKRNTLITRQGNKTTFYCKFDY
jgi:hypothetical protein